MTIGLNPAKLAETIPNSEKILKNSLFVIVNNSFSFVFISQIIRTVHIASSAFPGHLVTQLLLKVVNHVSVTVMVIQTSIFVT